MLEINKTLDDLSASMVGRAMEAELKIKDGGGSLELKQKEVLTKLAHLTSRQQANFKKQGFCNSDASLIEGLELQIDYLNARIQCNDLVIKAPESLLKKGN